MRKILQAWGKALTQESAERAALPVEAQMCALLADRDIFTA